MPSAKQDKGKKQKLSLYAYNGGEESGAFQFSSECLFVWGGIIRELGLAEWRAFQKVPVGETMAVKVF